MDNLIIIAILALIIGSAARYVYKARKQGVKCIGCPDGASCPHSRGGSCSGSCGGCRTSQD